MLPAAAQGQACVAETEETDKLTALDAAEFDQFGWSVAISGDTAVIGPVGDVDANDFLFFNTCKTQDKVPHNGTPFCQAADFDADNDVDSTDFSKDQRCISGTNVPADPACAP